MAISEAAVQDALIAVLAGQDDPPGALTSAAECDIDEDGDEDYEDVEFGQARDEHDRRGVGVDSVSSFADDGVMTDNKGVVLRLTDGSEFQLTIVRSVRSRW